jgi:hypothetical protein
MDQPAMNRNLLGHLIPLVLRFQKLLGNDFASKDLVGSAVCELIAFGKLTLVNQSSTKPFVNTISTLLSCIASTLLLLPFQVTGLSRNVFSCQDQEEYQV